MGTEKRKGTQLKQEEENQITKNNKKIIEIKKILEEQDMEIEQKRKLLLKQRAMIGLMTWCKAKKERIIEEQWNSKHIDITDDKKIKTTKIGKYMYKIPTKYLHGNTSVKETKKNETNQQNIRKEKDENKKEADKEKEGSRKREKG